MSIGAVLGELRAEFPDVTISKIRFLEAEGLVRPGRTPSGYRQFAQADVERLRFVLRAQRDQYLPLKVIKEQLAAADRGDAPGPRAVVPDPPADRADHTDQAGRPLTRADVLGATGLDAATLAQLEEFGLIKAGPAGFYEAADVELGAVVKAMADFGIEPRHLRAFRTSADREVGLIEQIVTPMYRQHDSHARGRADEALRELTSLSVALHTLLVKSGLRRVSGR
ncbi:MAG: MerR family transcriptional regulator [Kibdelosporangium sp.]